MSLPNPSVDWKDTNRASPLARVWPLPVTSQCRSGFNWRAGGLEDRVSKWKTWTFGRLHKDRRAGRGASQKGGPAGCGKRLGGLQKRAVLRPALLRSPAYCAAHQPALMCRPLAHPVVQPAGQPFCARGKFMLFIWQHGPPALRLVLSRFCSVDWTFINCASQFWFSFSLCVGGFIRSANLVQIMNHVNGKMCKLF